MGGTTGKGSREIRWAAVGGITKGFAGALESSPSPKSADGEPAVVLVAVPSVKSDAQISDAAVSKPKDMLRAELQAFISCSPSSSVSDLRGPFIEFGEVRIRFWYVCFAGGKTPCGIMTTDDRFTYDWYQGPLRRRCCAKERHNYNRDANWHVIMQVCVLDTEFLIRTCEPTSNKFKLMYELSADKVQEAIREVKKYKFEDVFRHARKDDTMHCVDLDRTWKLNPFIQLPEWDLELLYSVVKHRR